MDDPDSGVLEEIGTGSESSSLPQSPKTFGEPLEIITDREERRVYSREQFMHESAGFDDYEVDGRSRYDICSDIIVISHKLQSYYLVTTLLKIFYDF